MIGLALYIPTNEVGYSCATTSPGNENQNQKQTRKQKWPKQKHQPVNVTDSTEPEPDFSWIQAGNVWKGFSHTQILD